MRGWVENFSNSLRGLCDFMRDFMRDFMPEPGICEGTRCQYIRKSGTSHKLFETLTFQDQNIAPCAFGST